VITASVLAAATHTSTGRGEAVTFWVLAPIAVLAAVGVLFSKKAVHSALLLAATMLSLAILYLAQDAPFLGVVQVVVYTGAVMMLFLFVLMLVGVDSADSLVETLRGQRIAALVAALGFGGLLVFGLGDATVTNAGLDQANHDGNVQGLADLIFSRYVFAFEVTSALLIVAAMGAMILAHRERHEPRMTQAELSRQRFRGGQHPAPLPGPGVYARHNAVDTPALLPDGTPADVSVSRVLMARGDVRHIPRPERELVVREEDDDA
jgi:NADH-quinone oxidoreductase subunit J